MENIVWWRLYNFKVDFIDIKSNFCGHELQRLPLNPKHLPLFSLFSHTEQNFN